MRTTKQILAAISNIKMNGKALDASVQSVGLEVLEHVEAHKEVSLAIKLLAALPKGSRHKALADWFQKYGKISVNIDKATAKQFPLLFNKDGVTDLEGATKQEWWKCKQDKPLALEFNFAAQLSALLERAARAQAGGATLVGGELLERAKGLLAAPVKASAELVEEEPKVVAPALPAGV